MFDDPGKVPDYAVTRILKSGFTIAVTPLPPYYMDVITDIYPVKEYPKREIVLRAGDIYYEEYTPTEDRPEEEDDLALWLEWHEVKRENKKREERVGRMREELLLSLCVNILDGPIEIDDKSWQDRIVAPFVRDFGENIRLYDTVSQKRLLFIKYVVITTLPEKEQVISDAMFTEVSLQGISNALNGFQGDMGPGTADRSSPSRQSEKKSTKPRSQTP